VLRPVAFSLLLAGLIGCGPAKSARPLAQPSPEPASAPIIISIVGTNDLHGGIVPRDGKGGLALFGGYVKNLRAARAKDGAVLLLDGGDIFQGTLESNLGEGATTLAAYNALGYTAVAVGNHEFDFGPVGPAVTPRQPGDDPRGALKARAADAKFPFLAANLIDSATGRPVSWPNVQPSVIVDAGELKVGIIGVMTLRALSATMAGNVMGLRVAPLAQTITEEATALRAKGAQLVIVTAHAGGRCKAFDEPTDLSSCDANAEIFQVADAQAPGLVDAIVAGHSHAGVAHVRNNIPIIESYTGGRTFGRIDLTVDRSSKRVTGARVFSPAEIELAGIYEGQPIAPDAAIAAVIEPQLTRVSEVKASSLGVILDTPLPRSPIEATLESPLGNLFTNVLVQSVPGADIAINNTGGGIRGDLAAGPLTYGALFQIYPFDNMIVRFNLPGAVLRNVLATRADAGFLPGIAGLHAVVKCVAGAMQVDLKRPDGRSVADDERLTIVTTDFLATGGDDIFAAALLPEPLKVEDTGIAYRDAVAEWFKKRGGRLRDTDLIDRENPRWSMPVTRCQ
jgi:5'-nucleotidase